MSNSAEKEFRTLVEPDGLQDRANEPHHDLLNYNVQFARLIFNINHVTLRHSKFQTVICYPTVALFYKLSLSICLLCCSMQKYKKCA